MQTFGNVLGWKLAFIAVLFLLAVVGCSTGDECVDVHGPFGTIPCDITVGWNNV